MALRSRGSFTYSVALFYLQSKETWDEESYSLLVLILQGVIEKLAMGGVELPVQVVREGDKLQLESKPK